MQNTPYFYLLLPQESWFSFHVLKMLLAYKCNRKKRINQKGSMAISSCKVKIILDSISVISWNNCSTPAIIQQCSTFTAWTNGLQRLRHEQTLPAIITASVCRSPHCSLQRDSNYQKIIRDHSERRAPSALTSTAVHAVWT